MRKQMRLSGAKSWAVALAIVFAALALAAPQSSADSFSRGNSDHPLRYIAYALHPLGVAIEYAALRPVHWLVSRPHLHVLFGHDPKPKDEYFKWCDLDHGSAKKK